MNPDFEPKEVTGTASTETAGLAGTGFHSAAAVIAQAVEWRDAGHGVALATVLDTWGSAPRRTGSLLAVSSSGDFCGSVSGGCVETAVIQEALKAIQDVRPRRLHFGVTNDVAWEIGLACGGKIQIRIEPFGASGASDDYARILALYRQRRAIVTATDLQSGVRLMIDPSQTGEEPLQKEARLAAKTGNSRLAILDGKEIFLHVFNPACRLILLGAVHIAQALAPMARLAGFDVVVVDHRQAFASARRFPGTHVLVVRAAEALRDLKPDTATAVVALTHNPDLDDPGLLSALASPAFYVAALGSRRTHAQRLERLRSAGMSDAALARLHGPAGLDIGAANPVEIAVSILAQMIQALRGNPSKE